jgi:mono/diheme cytochrome c family protein
LIERGTDNVTSQFKRLLLAAALSTGAFVGTVRAADEPAPAEKSEPAAAEKKADDAAPEAAASDAPAAPAADAAAGGAAMKPLDRVAAAEKGTLKNPFDWKDPKIAEEGHKIYLGLSSNGCHGGGGGGGMCPPLTNETWVYGGDDDTLFRLVTLGSQELQKKYSVARKGQENVVGPMPPFGELIDDETKLWKVIAWIRTVWKGRAEKITW